MSFNAGDKVICVDDNADHSLTQNKIYTVINLWDNNIKIKNDFNEITWYYPYRFKLAHKVEKEDLL